MRRLVLLLAGLLLLIVPGAPAAAPGRAATDIPRVRVAIDSATQGDARTQRRLVADARSLSLVVLNKWSGPLARRMKRANPRLKVLIYEDISRCTEPGYAGRLNALVSRGECEARGWSTGVVDPDAGGVIARIDIAGYRVAAGRAAGRDIRTRPWADGVFLDDVNAFPGNEAEDASTQIPPARWRQAMGATLRRVAANVPAPKLQMPNFHGSWGQCNLYFASFCDRMLTHVNAGFDEFFGRWKDGSANGFIRDDIRALENASSRGKWFAANFYASGARAATETSLAAYLIGNRARARTSSFGWYADEGVSRALLRRARELGPPTGPRYTDSAGVWRRSFRRGYVRVNVERTPRAGLPAYTGVIVKTS